jgi:hypothetical protein
MKVRLDYDAGSDDREHTMGLYITFNSFEELHNFIQGIAGTPAEKYGYDIKFIPKSKAPESRQEKVGIL